MSEDKTPTEIKLADLPGVREHQEHDTVELWLNRKGRVVVRAFNECHNNLTDVDLVDLLDWLFGSEFFKVSEDGRISFVYPPRDEM